MDSRVRSLPWMLAAVTPSNVSAQSPPCRMKASPAATLAILLRSSSHSPAKTSGRSEEHTSELQSRQYLVCRLLLEKKKRFIYIKEYTHITEKQDAHSSKTSCSRNFYIQYYINYTQIMTILHNIL